MKSVNSRRKTSSKKSRTVKRTADTEIETSINVILRQISQRQDENLLKYQQVNPGDDVYTSESKTITIILVDMTGKRSRK